VNTRALKASRQLSRFMNCLKTDPDLITLPEEEIGHKTIDN